MGSDGLQRVSTLSSRLIRLGVRDIELAMALLLQEHLGPLFAGESLDDLDLAPDPDQLLSVVADIAATAPTTLSLLEHDHGARHEPCDGGSAFPPGA